MGEVYLTRDLQLERKVVSTFNDPHTSQWGVESCQRLIGRTLSHYEIADRLGAGGMGEVYLARDTRLERKVALKVLPPDLADDPERLKRLVREAKALAALDHPHIVTVFSVEEDEGVHFITMAYVEGRSLDSMIPEGGLPVEELLDFAVPLADALRAAHERGIIHRDLKPANVMVDSEGRLRVLDFGLAKRYVAMSAELTQATTQGLTKQMTREGTILGSYPYMSPEQAEGRAVDARSDLFSLGTLLYEMACASRPFEGETGIALITAILRDSPTPLAERRPDLPQRLVEIIERCLEKDVESRYASAADLREDLEALRRDVRAGAAVLTTETAAEPTSPADFLRRSKPARLVAMVALALIAIAAVLGSVWSWRSRRPADARAAESAAVARDVSSIAVLPFTNLTGDPEQEYFVDGVTEALITDLSKIGALKVISRSSVKRYKGTETPLGEIAAVLGVDAILEGAVAREGDRVAITAQLIEAATGDNLWADRYVRDLTSILSLQGEIARAIAGEIDLTVTPSEEDLLAVSREVDPKAYEAYLRGNFHLDMFTPQDFDRAIGYFEAALDVDPQYALAHIGVAKVWASRSQLGLVPPGDAAAELKKALARALEIDDSLAEAQFVLASTTTWHDWDWENGENAFLRAIELNPNYAEARIFYSHLLAFLGRGRESTAQVERALELDPLNPFYQGLYGIQLGMTGRVEEAIAQLRRTHEMAPGFDFGRQPLAYLLGYIGRPDEALGELRTHYAGVDDREVLEALDGGEAAAGYAGATRAVADVLTERSRSRWVHSMDVSALYEMAGDTERAMQWLERGYEVRDPDMPYIGAVAVSEQLRAQPGFQDLLRRLNLPDARAAYR